MTVTKRGDLLQDLEFHKPLVQSCDESAKAWESRLILQRVLERLILDDVDYAVAKRLEQELWHLCFKSFIDKLNARLKSTANAKPSDHDLAMLNVLLSAAHDSLSRTLTELSIHYGYKGVKIMSQTSLGILNQQFAKPKKASSGNLEYLSQFLLVHLGDISRYQKQLRLAESYYLHATKLAFSNGHAFNQLGILEASRGSRLSAVYFYYRSLNVATPFVLAETNLDQLYKSLTKHILDGIVENDSSQKPPVPQNVKPAVGGVAKLGPSDDMSVTKGNYVHQYLVCLALIHQCVGLDKASRLVDGLTSGRILVDVAETGGGVQSYGLTHMMVINMAAIGRLYAAYLSKEDMSSRLGCIDQIASQLSDDERTCLHLLHGLFLGQISDILFYATSLSDAAAVASISAVIRLALVWITSHPWFLEYARWGGPRPDGTLDGSGNVVVEASNPGGTHSPANFCQFLNDLVRFLNVMQEPTEIRRPKGFRDSFALPEEVELRGFQPLQTIGFANLDFSVDLNNFDEMQIQKARLLRLFSASKAIVDAVGDPAIVVCEHPATDSGKLVFRCGNIAMLDKNRSGSSSSAGKLEDCLIAQKSQLDEARQFSKDGSNGGGNGETGILDSASPTWDSGRNGRGKIGFNLGDERGREGTRSPASAGGSPLANQNGLTAGKSSKINVALKSIISNNAKAGVKPYSMSMELMKETATGVKQIEGANLVSPPGAVPNDSKSTPSGSGSLRNIPGAIKIAAPGMAVELPIKIERRRKEAGANGENVDDADDDDDDDAGDDDDRELGGNYKLEENLQRISGGKIVGHSGQSDPLRASGSAGIGVVHLGSKGRPMDPAEDADGAGGPNDPAGSNRPRYELPPRFQAAKLKMALGGAQFRKAEMPQGIDVTAKEGDTPSPPPFMHPYHDPSMEYGVKQHGQIQLARRGQRGNVVTGQLRGNGAYDHPQSSSFAAFPPLSNANFKGHHLLHQQRDFEGTPQRGDHGGGFLPPRFAKGIENSAEGIRGYAPSVAGLLANFKDGSDSESGIRQRPPDDLPGGARQFHESQSGNTFPGSDGHRQSLSLGVPNFGPTEGGHQKESMNSDIAGMNGGVDDFPKTPGVRPPFGPPIYGPGGPFMFPGTPNFPNHGGPPQVGGLATMYNVGHPRPPTFLPPPDFMMPGGFNNSQGVARGAESGGNNVLTRPPMFDSLHRHPFYGVQHQHQPPFSQLPQMLSNPQLPFSTHRPQQNPRPVTGGDEAGFPPLLSAKRGDKDSNRMNNNNNWDEEQASVDGRRASISRSVEGGSGGEEYPHGKKTVGQRLLHDSGGSSNCESALGDSDIPQRSLAYQRNSSASATQFPDKDGHSGGAAKSGLEDAREMAAKVSPAQGKPGGGVPATVANLPTGMLPEFLINRQLHQQQFPPNLFLNAAGSGGSGQMFSPPDLPMVDQMPQNLLQPGMGRTQPDQLFDGTRGFGQSTLINQGVLDMNQSLAGGDELAGQSNLKQSLAQQQQHQHQQFGRDQQRSFQQQQQQQGSTRDPQLYAESEGDRSSRHNPTLGAGAPRQSLVGKTPTDINVSNPLNFNEPAISCFPSYIFPPPNMSVTGSMPSGNVGHQHLLSTTLNQQKPSFPPPSFNNINNLHHSQALQYFQQASFQQQQQQPMFNIGGCDPLFGSSSVGIGGNHHYLMTGGSGGSNIGLPPPASLGGQTMITGDPGVDRLEAGLAKLAGQAQTQPRKMMSNESDQQMLASAISSGAPQFMTHTQNLNILTGGALKGSGGGGGGMFPSSGQQGSQGSSLVTTSSADQYGSLIRNPSQGDVSSNNSLGSSAASRIANSGETVNESNLAGASGVMNLNSGGGSSQHSTFGSPPSSGAETGGIAFTSPAGYSLFDSPWSVFSPVPEQLNRGGHGEAGGGVGRMASQASVSGSVAGQNVGMSSVGLDTLGGPNPAGSLCDGSVGASNLRIQQAGGGMGFMMSPGVAQNRSDAVDRGAGGKAGVGPTAALAGGRSRRSGGSPPGSSEYPRWSNNDDIQDK